MRQFLRRLGAVVIACALITLVACDITVHGFGAWWDEHAITTSIVSSLLIVGATALIFDEVVARRQRQDRAVAVAAQALIVYGQAREAYQATLASDDPSAVPDELRDLASNLLVAAPNLFDDSEARGFLLQADRLLSALFAALAGSGSPQDPGTRDHLTDLMSQLQQSFEPLLTRFPPDYQSRIRVTGLACADQPGTLSRKPRTEMSWPLSAVTATSKPTTRGSPPCGPRPQVKRVCRWWASTGPARVKTNPGN